MADAAAETKGTAAAKAPDLPSLDTRIEWYEAWEEKTADNQKLARRDRAYYDNDQWTREELAELKARGQPALVKNHIARKINFILGEEIKKRVDPVARPRNPSAEDDARAATDALRYADEEQDFDTVRSAVLKNVLVEGYGGALVGMDEEDEYKHTLDHIEWDRLFYDPSSRASDFSDARYLGIVLWQDLEDAIAEYPDAEDALRGAVNKARTSANSTTDDTPRGWADGKRQRVKIVEMYFHKGRNWYRGDFTESKDLRPPARTFLFDEKRIHTLCPLVMMSCYLDANGNRYGVVRQLISPQDEINKRSSKALHASNTVQVIAETEAIEDPTKFQTELAKPDGFATGITPGALAEGRVQIRTNGELLQGQLELLQAAQNDIDSIGPSSATLPDIPAGASGRAFIARQQAASQELGTVFDQLRAFTRTVYKLDWLCIRIYWTEERWLRVTDDQELTGYRFVALNRTMTRAQRMQELLKKQPAPPPMKALEIAAGEYAPAVKAQIEAQMQAMNAAQQQAAQAQQAQAAQQQQPAQMQPPAPGQPPPPQQPGQPPPQQQPQQPDPIQLILASPLMQEPVTVNQVAQMLVDIIIDEAPETAVLADEQFETLGQLLPTVVQAKPDMAGAMVKALFRASSLPNKRELLQEFEKGPDPQAMQMQQQVQQLQTALQAANVEVAKTKAELQQAQAQQAQAQAAKAAAEAQAIPAKTAADIAQSQAQSMVHAATAGEKSAMPPGMPPAGMPMRGGGGMGGGNERGGMPQEGMMR